MKPKSLPTILIEFFSFAFGRLVPMLAAWPVWSMRVRRQRRQVRQARVRRGRFPRNPTAKP